MKPIAPYFNVNLSPAGTAPSAIRFFRPRDHATSPSSAATDRKARPARDLPGRDGDSTETPGRSEEAVMANQTSKPDPGDVADGRGRIAPAASPDEEVT